MDVRAALVGVSGRQLHGLRRQQWDRIWTRRLCGWLYLQHQKDPEHRPRRRELQVLVKEISKGHLMKKFLVVICSVVLALGLAGCIGKGKAPVGKGKAPVVQTRG